MPVYTCERCLKEFSQKSHYNNHLKRKNPCQNNKDKIEQVVEKMVNEKIDNTLNKKLIGGNNKHLTNKSSSMEKQLTFDNDYNIIKNYYNTILNTDKTLVETSNDEPTPIDCVEEMISKIPESFWENKNIKILDPCCGCGNFPFVIYFKLLKYHSKKHILENMLYLNDINIKRLNVLKQLLNTDKLNIYNKDYLKLDFDIKFDLIVANPPYAKLLPNGKRASKNHNLIGLFIEKSFKLLQEKGLLLFITPDNWMSFANRNTLITELTNKQFHYINIHIAKKYFKKIGSSFVWYLIENTEYYKDINIEGIWKNKIYKSVVKSEERKYIPLFYNALIQSILSKTIDCDNKKFKIETSSDLHKYTKKHLISNIKNERFKYKLIHTPKQVVWSSRKHKFQEGFKVFISTTSYYGTFVDNCGMTQSIAFIRCKNKEEACNISKILNHPLYKFINNICRYGNFNNIRILQNFPYSDNYEKIYDTFNITEEEQKCIETNL